MTKKHYALGERITVGDREYTVVQVREEESEQDSDAVERVIDMMDTNRALRGMCGGCPFYYHCSAMDNPCEPEESTQSRYIVPIEIVPVLALEGLLT